MVTAPSVCPHCNSFCFTSLVCQGCNTAVCPDCLSVNGYCMYCVQEEFPDMPYMSYYDYDGEDEW